MLDKTKFIAFEVQNKACRSATATGLFETKTGVPKQEFYDFYKSLAAGKPGLLIMEHAFVSERGWAGHPQLGIHNDEMIQYHQKVIQIMREASPDIKICCQLAHAGPDGGAANKINIMQATTADFMEIVEQFKEAAIRAKKAGYDCVQINSANTYLLSQIISGHYNKRTDEWNAKEFKLLKLIAEAVKETGIITGVKLQCDDFIENGMDKEQAVKILQTIQFDFIEISGGGFAGHKYNTIRVGDDKYYYKHVMEAFKEAGVLGNQPVIVTGGFESIEDGKMGLNDGATMVGYSRKFLRNDKFIYDVEDKKKCFRCNKCTAGIMKESGVVCPYQLKEQQK